MHARPLPTATDSLGRAAAYGAADSADLSAVPIRAGKEKGSVTVQIVWGLA